VLLAGESRLSVSGDGIVADQETGDGIFTMEPAREPVPVHRKTAQVVAQLSLTFEDARLQGTTINRPSSDQVATQLLAASLAGQPLTRT
jgi:hypothetical protein